MTDVIDQVTREQGDKPSNPETTLDQLVGDGKRYTDPEKLAQSRIDADNYIKQLEAENADMRVAIEESEKTATRGAALEDIVEEVRKSASSADSETPTVSEEQIRKFVEDKLGEDRRETLATNNRVKVDEAVRALYPDGDKAATFVKERINQLQIKPEDARMLSENSPDAFIAMLGLNAPAPTTGSPTTYPSNAVNTATLDPSRHNARNASYYNAKRKEMGFAAFYNDKSIQKEKFESAQALGDDYFK